MNNQRGSMLVEFAIVAPLLIMLLLGIMMGGVLVNAKIISSSAAREAGRHWSIHMDDGRARDRAAYAMALGGLRFRDHRMVLFDPLTDVHLARTGDYISVAVVYRQPTLAPFIADLIDQETPGDGYVTLRSRVHFRVEG